MATDSQILAFMQGVMPTARKVEGLTGVPAPLMASIMSWETDAGNNPGSKYNNYAGIKFVNQAQATGGKVAGVYAGYSSPDDFAQDLSRILHLQGYGYPGIIQKAQTSPGDYAGIVNAWNKSSWAESDYNTAEIIRRANMLGANQTAPVGLGSAKAVQWAIIGGAILLLVSIASPKPREVII